MKDKTLIRFLLVALAVLGLTAAVWPIASEFLRAADRDDVTVSGRYAPASCKPGKPIEIVIRNASTTKTVKAVNLEIQVFDRGDSQNLAGHEYAYQNATYVIPPGQSVETCWMLNARREPESPVISVKKNYVTFFEKGEMIP